MALGTTIQKSKSEIKALIIFLHTEGNPLTEIHNKMSLLIVRMSQTKSQVIAVVKYAQIRAVRFPSYPEW